MAIYKLLQILAEGCQQIILHSDASGGNLLKRGQTLQGSHYFLTGYKRLGTLHCKCLQGITGALQGN